MVLWLYALLAGMIVLSAMFSGAEIAFFSVSDIKVRKLVRSRRKGALRLRKLKSDPHRLLVTILICNNIVNIASASIATLIATEAFGSSGVGIATGIMTFLILVFGEITPKSYFHQNNEKMSLLMSGPLHALSIILYPVIWFIEIISKALLHALGTRRSRKSITEEDIIAALSLGKEEGIIEEGEEKMMKNVIGFGDITVGDVMTPRKNIVALDSRDKLTDAMAAMLESGYSRMPVYAHGTKRIMGILNIRSSLQHIRDRHFDRPVTDMLSRHITVQESRPLDETLEILREHASHMAIVKDKAGRIAGLVTMEDLLEEIVGEIYDEADKRRHMIHFIDAKTATIRGDMLVKDLKERIGIPLRSGVPTVSQLVSARFGNKPSPGRTIKLKNFILTVMTVSKSDPSRITRIKVTKRRGKIRR